MPEIAIPKVSYRPRYSKDEIGEPFKIQVPPTIVPGSTITFCGESPGKNEVLERKGFVGGSGNVLWKMASAAGINSLQVNRTNIAKRRPAGDSFGIFYHDPKERKRPTEELIFWQQLLIKELEKYRPNVFVAVGDESLKAVCPNYQGISKYRGSILQSSVIPGMKVIPIMHPAWVMRMNWEWYYVGIQDLKKVKAESVKRERVLVEPEPQFNISPTIGQVYEFMNVIFFSPCEWNIDIETRGDTITCFALSTEALPDKALCVPIQSTTGPYWSEAEEVRIWQMLGKVFKANPRCMNQNLAYDIDYFLSDYRIEPSGFSFDPMIAQKFLYPEFDKGLDFTTSIYTNMEYYKDEGKTWKKKVPDEKVRAYNCKDVWTTPKVTKAIRANLQQAGQLENYQRLAGRFIPIALEMQRNRLKINQAWKDNLASILEIERARVHTELSGLTGIKEENLNVKSSPQVQHILYESLRLPIKKKRGTDKVSTEENIIKELRSTVSKDSTAYKVLNGILSERHLRTRQSNYINVTLDSDGYWPFQVLINNDKTGRWESKSSPKWRGSKVGHIPKVMRLMFEPPEGRLFVQRDLSQAEARYVGAEARCLFLNKTFADFDAGAGPKIHKLVGKLCWGVEPKQDSIEYDASKSIVHAYDYMMGPKRLAIEANLPFTEGARVYDIYGREVPEVPRWQQRIKDEATSSGRLTTPTGRIRQCYSACAMVANTGQLADEIWRDLVSWKPQATVPDVLNEGLYKTWEGLEWVFFHQQGHDSHLDSIPPGRLTEYAERTEVYHKVPILIDKEIELTIPSELSWGYLWGALKPWQEGDKGTRTEWEEWCEREGIIKVEGKGGIKERLYAMF